MAMYESEHTKFMRAWMAKHPEELQTQQTGRALWWDKVPQSLDEQQRLGESSIPTTGYYYQTK